jgi:hypothetical protein
VTTKRKAVTGKPGSPFSAPSARTIGINDKGTKTQISHKAGKIIHIAAYTTAPMKDQKGWSR